MDLRQLIEAIADTLKEYDLERPTHKSFKAGIGPFGEPQLLKVLAERLSLKKIYAITKRTPDLLIREKWALEVKIVRPFGDNGSPAENWSQNLLHPYPGNTSLLGDAIKLKEIEGDLRKAVVVLCYEHAEAKVDVEPLIKSFELIAREVMSIRIGDRIHEIRKHLVHCEHQVIRCYAWEIMKEDNGG